MVNKNTKPISVQNTRMILSRGIDVERARKTIKDGEVYFDMNGGTILMGVYQGVDKPIKVVEMSTGGSGAISPEQLANLLTKDDVVKEVIPNSSYDDSKVASANSVSSLAAKVIDNSSKIEVMKTDINNLKNAFNGTLSPEVQAYLQKVITEAKLEASQTITVHVTDQETVVIDVNHDDESLGKVVDEEGTAKLGVVWASYDSTNTDPSGVDPEIEAEGFSLTANIMG